MPFTQRTCVSTLQGAIIGALKCKRYISVTGERHPTPRKTYPNSLSIYSSADLRCSLPSKAFTDAGLGAWYDPSEGTYNTILRLKRYWIVLRGAGKTLVVLLDVVVP